MCPSPPWWCPRACIMAWEPPLISGLNLWFSMYFCLSASHFYLQAECLCCIVSTRSAISSFVILVDCLRGESSSLGFWSCFYVSNLSSFCVKICYVRKWIGYYVTYLFLLTYGYLHSFISRSVNSFFIFSNFSYF